MRVSEGRNILIIVQCIAPEYFTNIEEPCVSVSGEPCLILFTYLGATHHPANPSGYSKQVKLVLLVQLLRSNTKHQDQCNTRFLRE